MTTGGYFVVLGVWAWSFLMLYLMSPSRGDDTRGLRNRIARNPGPRPDPWRPPPARPFTPPVRPVPHPAEIAAQWFAVDGSHVYVTTADRRMTRHEVLTPAMRDVVRQMAAIRRAEQSPAALTLPQMWDMLGQPALAARERELERLAAEDASLRRANPEIGP